MTSARAPSSRAACAAATPDTGTGLAAGSQRAIESIPVKARSPFSPEALIIDTTAMWLLLSPPVSSTSSATATIATSRRPFRSPSTKLAFGRARSTRNAGSALPSSSGNAGPARYRPPPGAGLLPPVSMGRAYAGTITA